jgi:hypothetical protein
MGEISWVGVDRRRSVNQNHYVLKKIKFIQIVKDYSGHS